MLHNYKSIEKVKMEESFSKSIEFFKMGEKWQRYLEEEELKRKKQIE